MAILVAHRGFRTKQGENRMIDFKNALKTCKAVEFDIRMTKDKKIIIFHDENFKRIAKVKKNVRSLNYNQIKEIKFFKKNPQSIPPLFIKDFAIKLANKYQLINVEIKEDNYTKKEYMMIENALKSLKKRTKAEIIVSTFSHQDLVFISKLDSEMFKKGYLIEKLSNIDNNLINKFDYLNPNIKLIKKKKNISLIKKINLPMNIWTIKKNKDVEIINCLYEKDLIHSYISDLPDLKIN